MQAQPQERLYTDLYDSVRQSDLACELDVSDASIVRRALVGRLRFDLLFSRTLVLSDAQLLDGAYFLGQTPIEFLRAVQRNDQQPASIEIRARDPDLGNCLVKFVRPDSQAKKLTGFIFSSILDSAMAGRVATELASIPASSVNHWTDVPRVLKSIDSELKPIADRLETSWAKWIEAQQPASGERLLRVRCWDETRAFDLDAAMKEDPPEEGNYTNGEVLELIPKVKAEKRRSPVYQMIDELREQVRNDIRAVTETKMLRAWYDRAYNRAIAARHNCGFLGVGPILPASSSLEKTVDESFSENVPGEIELPEDFVPALGEMDSAAFRNLCQESAPHLNKWWGESDFAAFQRAMEPFVNLCSGPVLISAESWRYIRLFLAATGAAVGAILGPAGAAAGVLFPEVVYHIWHGRSRQQRDLRQIVEHARVRWRILND